MVGRFGFGGYGGAYHSLFFILALIFGATTFSYCPDETIAEIDKKPFGKWVRSKIHESIQKSDEQRGDRLIEVGFGRTYDQVES